MMPERIWIWFAENSNIRKWQSSAFDEGTAFVRADIYDALVKERNNLRGALTARAKTMLRLRAALTQVHDHIEDEGDRCYFGSTNDADTLKEVWQELDGWAWDAVMSDGKLPDVYEASRKAHERAEKAEAERDALAADKAELLAERDVWREKADNLAAIVGRWLALFDKHELGDAARALLTRHAADAARAILARHAAPAKDQSHE